MAAETETPRWKKEKTRLESLSEEDRRANYFCNDEFIGLSDIPTWKEYFEQHEKSLTEKVSEKDLKAFEMENPDLVKNSNLAEKVSLFRGDITKLELDAITNAANESLLGGGGVDGAIHRAAGKLLVAECRTLNGCETGQAKISCGYKLPAKHIIHTVGPRGEFPSDLQSCYETSLKLLLDHNLRSIAIPCISTGIYGYPQQNAALVALQTVRKFLSVHSEKVDRIVFCLFLESDVDIYEKQLQIYFPV